MPQKEAILKTKEKKSVQRRKGGIMELPDHILSSIVSDLPVRDAVNASLVSSKWRQLCAFKSKLNFNLYTMFGTCNTEHPGLHSCVCDMYKDRFVQGVNNFLQYHKGSPLDLFRAVFCLDSGCTSDIDNWVSSALNKGVNGLHLDLACLEQLNLKDRRLYTLRAELLSHHNAARLRRVNFTSLILGPGVIDQFSFLKKLVLAHMPLGQENIESIISCCLNLEFLVLLNCSLALTLCISGSLPQLKFLAVLCCSDLKEIDLSATNLVTFEYAGDLTRFSFSRVPNLMSGFFRVDRGIEMQYKACHEISPLLAMSRNWCCLMLKVRLTLKGFGLFLEPAQLWKAFLWWCCLAYTLNKECSCC